MGKHNKKDLKQVLPYDEPFSIVIDSGIRRNKDGLLKGPDATPAKAIKFLTNKGKKYT